MDSLFLEPILLDHYHREQWRQTITKKVREYESKASKTRRHGILAKWTHSCKAVAAAFNEARKHKRFQQAAEKATDGVLQILEKVFEREDMLKDLQLLRAEIAAAAYSSPYSTWTADADQMAAYAVLRYLCFGCFETFFFAHAYLVSRSRDLSSPRLKFEHQLR